MSETTRTDGNPHWATPARMSDSDGPDLLSGFDMAPPRPHGGAIALCLRRKHTKKRRPDSHARESGRRLLLLTKLYFPPVEGSSSAPLL